MSLDINQCKKYKEWGLSQSGIKYGDVTQVGNKYYRPTLEEQLAFVVEKAKEKDNISISRNKRDEIYLAGVSQADKPQEMGVYYGDSDPQQALYKLTKYIMGSENREWKNNQPKVRNDE